MYGLAILGAGPAGTGPLVWAAQHGKLTSWLDIGIAVVERSGTIGGTIGKYAVNADSLGASFIECLEAPAAPAFFSALRHDDIARELQQRRHEYPPLELVGEYVRRLGVALEAAVTSHPGGDFLPNRTVEALHLKADGSVSVSLSSGESLRARTALLALGGCQDFAMARDLDIAAGLRRADIAPEKTMLTDSLLTAAGIRRAGDILRQAPSRRTVIVGGSHSAFSSAWALLNKLPDAGFGDRDIAIVHRRAPRIFYPTMEAALSDGYAATERDVCPFTKRVHRLGGLRNDGRDLWRRLTGRPGMTPETRVELVSLWDPDFTVDRLRRLLDDAALVVLALGYRLATVPVYDAEGRRLPLMAEQGGCAVSFDSRLKLADGTTLPNVFAVGLGSGYRPLGDMAGEPSFDGQQNSLWLYQNGLGRVIYDGVQEYLQRADEAPRPMALAPTEASG